MVNAGTWLTERGAALAHDRLVLFLKADRELNFPKRAKKLGAASEAELKGMARLEYRGALGQVHYEGVSRQTEGFRTGGFSARATLRGRTVAVGIWPTEREAALARDRAMLASGVEDARLNFPREAKKLGGASVAELRRLARIRYQELTGAASVFWGVTWDPRRRLWKAMAHVDRQPRDLGSFPTEKEAALRRDRVERWHRGKRARLNFPDEVGPPLSPMQARRLAEKEAAQRASGASPAAPRKKRKPRLRHRKA